MPKNSQYTLEQLKEKLGAARATHLQWVSQFQDAFWYVTPNRDSLNQIFSYFDVGIFNNRQIYNTTASTANVTRANRLVRMLMPDNQRWGTLNYQDEDAMNAGLTADDFTNAENAQYYYLNSSNLSQQTQDAFSDVGIGAGAIWVDDPTDEKPLNFQAIPGPAVMPEFYAGNEVRDLWFPILMSGQAILDSYDESDLGLHKAIIAVNPTKTYWISRGVIHDPDPRDRTLKWRVVDLLHGLDNSNADDCIKVYDRTFSYKRLIYFRDRVRPGEVAGRGPAIEYLPLIRRLNELTRLSDASDEIRAFPPVEVDETRVNLDILGDLTGTSVPKGSFGSSLELPPSPQVTEKIERMEMQVNHAFSVNPLGDLNQPVRTAAEVNERIDAAQQSTTIDVSRLLTESSKALFETCFAILLERGLIPNSAKFRKALDKNTKAVLFSYQNPLGDIEKTNNLLRIERMLQLSQQYLGPQLWTMQYDPAVLQDFLSDNSGLPDNLMFPGAQIKVAVSKLLSQQPEAPSLPQSTTEAAAPPPLTQRGFAL